jgi:hypothetical protein
MNWQEMVLERLAQLLRIKLSGTLLLDEEYEREIIMLQEVKKLFEAHEASRSDGSPL